VRTPVTYVDHLDPLSCQGTRRQPGHSEPRGSTNVRLLTFLSVNLGRVEGWGAAVTPVTSVGGSISREPCLGQRSARYPAAVAGNCWSPRARPVWSTAAAWWVLPCVSTPPVTGRFLAAMLEVSSLSLAPNRVGTHPPGRVDTTVTGPLAQAPIRSQRPAGDVQERATRTGRRIRAKTAIVVQSVSQTFRVPPSYILTVSRRATGW
jgi:hypothetical protein